MKTIQTTSEEQFYSECFKCEILQTWTPLTECFAEFIKCALVRDAQGNEFFLQLVF